MVDKLEHWQLTHYQEIELPRLQALIDKASANAESTVKLLENAEPRFKKAGFKSFSSNDISGVKRDKTSGPVKTSAITDRTIYKLAFLLDIDPDLSWGALFLRLYLSGKIDNLSQPTLNAIKDACSLNPDVSIEFNVLNWLSEAGPRELRDLIVSAVNRLAKIEPSDNSTKEESLYVFIQSILVHQEVSLSDLLMNTALTQESLELLKQDKVKTTYELESLASWLTEITNEVWTAASLLELYEIQVQQKAL
ncbi:MAG: hypothetical protein AAGA46_00170 [Cyanobacteria bacterium P01_F01_bin.13]